MHIIYHCSYGMYKVARNYCSDWSSGGGCLVLQCKEVAFLTSHGFLLLVANPGDLAFQFALRSVPA